MPNRVHDRESRPDSAPGWAFIALLLAGALACDAATLEDIAVDCSREGELEVELGEDRDGFVVVPADGEPQLFHGNQGGTHLILAARLRTPEALDRYTVAVLAEAGVEPCDAAGCADWLRIGGFEVELDASSGQIAELGPGELEITRLFLVVDNWAAAPRRRLSLEVTDLCGRRASTARTFD